LLAECEKGATVILRSPQGGSEKQLLFI
jgi:hypothetical protein